MGVVDIADREMASKVVSVALVRAAADLGLNGSQLARTIGLSEATVSRVRRGACIIPAGSKPYELSMMVIRIHQALMKTLAEDREAIQSWMRQKNKDFGSIPCDRIYDIRGLVAVLTFAESSAVRE